MPCLGLNKRGQPCKAPPRKGQDYCPTHDPATPVEKRFGTVEQASIAGKLGGRPRRPREIEMIQEVADEYKAELRGVLVDGLVAERGLVVGDGPNARIEYVPDHGHRLKTWQAMLDRLHGKPVSSLDARIDQQSVNVNLDVNDPDTRQLIAELLRKRPARLSEPG